MDKIKFFTPVSYNTCKQDVGFKLTRKEWFAEKADSYFYLGGRVAYVLPKEVEGKSSAVVLKPGMRQSVIRQAIIVASYLTLILPVLMLAIKLACRLTLQFHISPIRQKLLVSPQTLDKFYGAMRGVRKEMQTNKEVQAGYGEYVVFRETAAGKQLVEKEVYERVDAVFKHYTPHRNPAAGHLPGQERYTQIRNQVKAISPDLEVAFIPRTLLELIFLRQCVEEDLTKGQICHMLSPHMRKPAALEALKNRVCWHKCYIDEEHTAASQEERIKDVSFAFNNALVKKLPSKGRLLSFDSISLLLNDHLRFFRDLHESSRTAMSVKAHRMANCNFPGPTTQLAVESSRGQIRSMGISNEEQERIVSNAVTLECSKVAETSLLVYRGGNLQEDLPQQYGAPYSLSYGTGLFAGALFDGGATAFHFMRQTSKNNWLGKSREAYAVPVPCDELKTSPVHIPGGSVVEQISAHGEWFHARSKCWKLLRPEDGIGGINGLGKIAYHKLADTLKHPTDALQFCERFNAFNQRAISLKN
ncbi:MAG: DUF648 domain-containing protein [Parachlamydia sp.]|nr:DUF648 domain-containing protein [Parachlamydia sp.]